MRVPAGQRKFIRSAVKQTRGQRVGRPKNLPPPIGGWNARDSLEAMAAQDAVLLSNWFPRQSDVISRPGYSEHCDTGISATIRTVINYEYADTSKMLACLAGSLVDVTTSTPTTLLSGQNDSDWVTDTLNGSMFMCNGLDTVKVFNGTGITDSTFTGVTLSTLIFVEVYKQRLFFVQKNTTKMWYGGVQSITGALTEFDFATVASVKGHLMAMATMTGDGGAGGPDDAILFFFSGGTLLVYNGSDPGDADNWSIVGNYPIGRPLSRFGFLEAGGDVLALTTKGIEKINTSARLGVIAPADSLVSAKIQLAITQDIAAVGVTDEWKLVLHPLGQMMMVVVPRGGTARYIAVQNINTKAWCRFDDLPGHSWALLGSQPYFGSTDGVVYAFDDDSLDDNGAVIVCDAQPAWNFLGAPGYNKSIGLIRPYFKTEVYPATALSTGVEFNPILVGTYQAADTGNFALWDEAVWDTAEWSPGNITYNRVYNRPATGNAIGMRVAVQTSLSRVEWNMTQLIYKLGGLI